MSEARDKGRCGGGQPRGTETGKREENGGGGTEGIQEPPYPAPRAPAPSPCLFSLSCRSNSSKSDMLRRPRRPCAALASPCRPPAQAARLLPPLASTTSGRRRRSATSYLIKPRLPAPPRLRPSPRPPARPPARGPSLQSLAPKLVGYFRTVEGGVGAAASAISENTRSKGFAGFPGFRNFSEIGSSAFERFRRSSRSSGPSPLPRVRLLPAIQTVPVFGGFRGRCPLLFTSSVQAVAYFRQS